MQTSRATLFTRDDTFFGVCEGLGEDFGFNPNYLRVTLPLLLFVDPIAAAGIYAAGGALVLISRLLFPDPRPAAAEMTHAPQPVEGEKAASIPTADVRLDLAA